MAKKLTKSRKSTRAAVARSLGITPGRLQQRQKNSLGLCSLCPLPEELGGKHGARRSEMVRAGLCGRHYEDHVRRSRERMRERGGFTARGKRAAGTSAAKKTKTPERKRLII